MESAALGGQQQMPRFESGAIVAECLGSWWVKAYVERRKAQVQVWRSMALKSLRLLFALLVGLTLLFTLSTELTYRVGVHGILNQTLNKSLFVWPGHKALISGSQGLAVNFNQTLLSYAAIQIGEAEERQQIGHLLDASSASYDAMERRYGGRGRSITYRSDRDLDLRSDLRGRGSSRNRIPVQLLHPRYANYWPVFRRALRSWVQNKRFEPTVMAELIDLVKVPLDEHYMKVSLAEQQRSGNPLDSRISYRPDQQAFPLNQAGQRRGYRSCAVVGNSGILLQKPHGPLIDSHDMVIRLNNARTAGFQNNVGSKTTLAFVNSNILHSCSRRAGCFCHPYGETVPIIMYICQAVHFMDYALCNASHKVPLLITDARFDSLCARIVKYYSLKNFVETTGKHPEEWSSAHEGSMFHYSSGMQAVMLALGICEKVSIFGFGKSGQAKHHYHTNQKFELKLHDYEAEYQFYADLVNGSQYIPFLSEAGIKLPPVQIYF
ncbi:hypothetical protein SUGI_1203780 [Cryptomeria japonica]|uniref:beta-1,6-galactosyltransferase GALT29A n=1 Tax=Cryptomeria japonica TaxID=3369 RepID=UPI0024149A76|nr:beta-1,6-galactosyltransferase GALT29A [Cryptomeria japonica]GLJ56073.1 hypothetical protein SUGI_1203780 [Cryptomeria japonica]